MERCTSYPRDVISNDQHMYERVVSLYFRLVRSVIRLMHLYRILRLSPLIWELVLVELYH